MDRFIIGFISIVLGILYSAWWYVLAIVMIWTAVSRKCLAYDLLEIRTTAKEKKEVPVKKSGKKKNRKKRKR